MNRKTNWIGISLLIISLFLLSACQADVSSANVVLPVEEPAAEKLTQAKETTATLQQGEQDSEQDSKQDQEKETPLKRYQVYPKTYMIEPVDHQPEEKIVLLTFDDTPTGKATNQILDTLDKFDAKAIFFVNGHYAEPNKELLKEIANRGHIVGNHTWWHLYLRKEDPETVRREIVELNDFIEEQLGTRPTYFRPPFGQNSEASLAVIQEEGMQTMNWSNGSLDWELKTPEEITEQVLSNIKSGDNILFHDKQVTADALEGILQQLTEQGYSFVLPTEVIN